MKELRENYWAVEVPDGAKNFRVGVDDGTPYFDYLLGTISYVIKLEPGTWEIVCTSKEATEEQAEQIVEEVRLRGNIRYEDYTREFMWQETAIESLRSLLTSKGCDLNNNYLILKKTA